ncbi:hypothetical protein J6590_051955 [Homalodisca vitripennis]|nr:hypothetical protein J6590_051955 [Homalodisca vitripennis]
MQHTNDKFKVRVKNASGKGWKPGLDLGAPQDSAVNVRRSATVASRHARQPAVAVNRLSSVETLESALIRRLLPTNL